MASSSVVLANKKGKGRQKVEMRLIENENNRLVTFSKRRAGVFKKASELCTLTDAVATVVAFSPGNKAFSIGHPTADAIIDRFMFDDNSQTQQPNVHPRVEASTDPDILRSNMELTFYNNQVDIEKKRVESLQQVRKSMGEEPIKFIASVKDHSLQDLQRIEASLIEMKRAASQHAQRLLEAQSNAHPSPLRMQNPTGETFYNPPNVLGGQNLNPNSAQYYAPIPTRPTFGDASQMVPPSVRGLNDNSPMIMNSTPMTGFEGPSFGMNSMHPGNANIQGGPNLNEGQMRFGHANFQGGLNLNEGQMRFGHANIQGGPNLNEGQMRFGHGNFQGGPNLNEGQMRFGHANIQGGPNLNEGQMRFGHGNFQGGPNLNEGQMRFGHANIQGGPNLNGGQMPFGHANFQGGPNLNEGQMRFGHANLQGGPNLNEGQMRYGHANLQGGPNLNEGQIRFGHANFQGGPNLNVGQSGGFQATPSNPGESSTPSLLQSTYTALLMGDSSTTTSADPFNPHGGFGYGPGMP